MIKEEFQSKNLPMSVDYIKGFASPKNSLHYHQYHEISVIKSGDISYCTENTNSKAKDFCIIFSEAHKLHNPFVSKRHLYERYQVKFRSEIMDEIVKDAAPLRTALSGSFMKKVNQKDFAELYDIIKRLFDMVKEGKKAEFDKLHEGTQLISLILKCRGAECINAPSGKSYIDDVSAYIKENMCKKITQQEIADNFLVSKSKLIYDFRECYNMNILEYITMMRIDKAKEMLLSGFSVSYTAEKCGFSSASYFIKVFSGITKTTPLAFQGKWAPATGKKR